MIILQIALHLDILKINFPSYKCNFAKKVFTWPMHSLCLKTVEDKSDFKGGFLINENVWKKHTLYFFKYRSVHQDTRNFYSEESA